MEGTDMVKTCIIPGCKKKKSRRNLKCSMHLSREYRAKYPIQAYYYNLKKNAKQRHIAFDLSIEAFIRFCIKWNFIELKGRGEGELTVDRISNQRGYVENNLQALSLRDNGYKGLCERYAPS